MASKQSEKKSIKKKEKPAGAASPSPTSTSLPFPISIVCWVDILGYGAAMSAASFNPLHAPPQSPRSTVCDGFTPSSRNKAIVAFPPW